MMDPTIDKIENILVGRRGYLIFNSLLGSDFSEN